MPAKRISYSKEVLIEILGFHWPTTTHGCACGWRSVEKTHPEHVAHVYELSMLAREGTDDVL